MIQCPYCGYSYYPTQTTCPYCQRPNPALQQMHQSQYHNPQQIQQNPQQYQSYYQYQYQYQHPHARASWQPVTHTSPPIQQPSPQLQPQLQPKPQPQPQPQFQQPVAKPTTPGEDEIVGYLNANAFGMWHMFEKQFPVDHTYCMMFTPTSLLLIDVYETNQGQTVFAKLFIERVNALMKNQSDARPVTKQDVLAIKNHKRQRNHEIRCDQLRSISVERKLLMTYTTFEFLPLATKKPEKWTSHGPRLIINFNESQTEYFIGMIRKYWPNGNILLDAVCAQR